MSDTPQGTADSIARVRLPHPERLFEARARRLVELSGDHPAAPFLALLARVARGQHRAVRSVTVPPGAHLLEGRPLDHARWRLDGAWREMLRAVLDSAADGPLPEAAAAVIAHLGDAPAHELDALAARVLDGSCTDLAAAPFVGAALQAYFSRLAGGLDERAVSPGGEGCPVCGAGPVAGVVLGDQRLRYLTCALCATEWYVPRVLCAVCSSTSAVSYFSVDEAYPGVSAEACDDCGLYVKLFDLERAIGAEPAADDAATLVLDLLVAERGYHRAGGNLIAPSGGAGEHAHERDS